MRRLFALLIMLPSLAFGFGKDQVGTSGAQFLKIAPGARPAGMSEAFTGVADDVHSIYWNPAGLGTMKRPELTGMHMQYFQEIQYEFAAFAHPSRYGTFGFAVMNLHLDDIERRTQDTDAPTGEFGASDSAYYLSYGKSVTSRLSLGANTKFIHQKLDSVTSNAYAVDGGALYNTDWHDVRLGASVLNLGSKVKFQNESDPLPLTYRLGGSAPLLSRRLLVSGDVIIPRDHEIGFALGNEYKGRISQGVGYAVRAGYRTDSDVDGFKGLSIGSGLEFGRTSFDFAWVPFGELGNAYRFGLHVKFGEPGESMESQVQMKQASASTDSQIYPLERDSALEQLLSL